MLRRSILELSSRQSVRRNLTRITTQTPLYLSYSRQYSVASDKHASQGSGSSGKPPEAGNSLSKVIIGTVALGAAFMAAYQWNSLEERRKSLESAKIGTKDPVDLPKSINDLQEDKQLQEKNAVPSVQDSNVSSTDASTEDNIGTSDSSHLDDLNRKAEGTQFQVEDKTDLTPGQEDIPTVSMTSDVESKTSGTSVEEIPDMKNTELNSGIEQEKVESTPVREQVNAIPTENEMKSTSPQLQTAKDILEDAVVNGVEQQSSLLDEYYLRDKAEPTISTLSDKHKDLVGAIEDSNDVYISKDGKLVLDFLEAIHAAEKRQAELDARVFVEEKRKMKERYEKELKDARARQLMYAEEAAILDKELSKERVKAAAALKSLQEELQGKLKMELEQKEAEVESELKQMQELAKAELAAAIASEKASQIEKMAEANLHINALCLAFYARSEEARQSHSLHKLALGALALEDVLSKGLPIQKEIEALHVSVEGIDKDPLVELVLSSLPEETRDYGTDTILQLRHKFDALKGMLRHFSLIPPGGGGVLAHSLAHIASWLKVQEADQSGDGIESLINRVESLLAEGKLAEAADTLENGVKGTQAAEVIGEWLKQARNRAITEQALTLLQSYATSISLS